MPFCAAKCRLHQLQILQSIAHDVLLQVGENRKVRLKTDDASLGVNVLKVKNGHPDVTPAVQNEGIRSLGFKMINAMDKYVFVEDVEVEPIVDADSVM